MRFFAPHHPLQLVAGQSAWLLWFALVYGAQAVACVFAAPDPARGPLNAINFTLLALSAPVAAGLAWAAWTCWRAARAQPDTSQEEPAITPRPSTVAAMGARSGEAPAKASTPAARTRFIARTSGWLYAAASAQTLFVAATLLMVPPCV
ncbi:hypothetical protein WG922_06075 [Ramlibacter sp. AN1015]|uniref:hypothetical protein n=1 Tax=Ramlibacter sp. AN1015 TaxID=3133428 RepID=UPI0030C5AF12